MLKKIIKKIIGIKEIIDLGEGKSMVLRMMIRKWGYLKIFIKVSWLFYLFIMYIFFVKDYDKY